MLTEKVSKQRVLGKHCLVERGTVFGMAALCNKDEMHQLVIRMRNLQSTYKLLKP